MLHLHLSEMDIHRKLKELRLKKGASLEDVGKAIGVSWQTVQQWENGKTAPRRTRAQLVADYFEVSLNYLMTDDATVPTDFTLIPLMDLNLSAGTGNIVTSFDINKQLSFRTDFLVNSGVMPSQAMGFPVDGDSMVDAHILDGSVVVIDRAKVEPTNRRIFAMWIEDQYLVKEVIKEKGIWIARSHNKARESDYPDIPITSERCGIIGRAFWCGFKL